MVSEWKVIKVGQDLKTCARLLGVAVWDVMEAAF